MLEKRWPVVLPQAFTANGTANGVVTVPDTTLFKVKQDVHISATSLPTLYKLEVKEVLNATQMVIGPDGGAINLTTDLSAYTVALSANVFCPTEQKRPAIASDEYMRAVYEEEPTVALRVFQVDELGNDYNDDNPFPVAFDGTISIGDVSIVEDGNTLGVNPDGSINVNVVNSTSLPGLNIFYNEAPSVASGIETNVITFTATGGGFRLNKIYVAGENIALFRVKLNGTIIVVKRTFFGNLNEEFAFEDFVNGLELVAGDQVRVTVLHTRPSVADFEATIMGLNL
jgi:hypothetical protein